MDLAIDDFFKAGTINHGPFSQVAEALDSNIQQRECNLEFVRLHIKLHSSILESRTPIGKC